MTLIKLNWETRVWIKCFFGLFEYVWKIKLNCITPKWLDWINIWLDWILLQTACHTDAFLSSMQVPHDDSATFESALSWALYWNDKQYVNLSTTTLPRIVFMYNCKFKYETEERYELGQRSTMKHEYEVLKRDVSQGKPSMGEFLSL